MLSHVESREGDRTLLSSDCYTNFKCKICKLYVCSQMSLLREISQKGKESGHKDDSLTVVLLHVNCPFVLKKAQGVNGGHLSNRPFILSKPSLNISVRE